MRAVDRKGTVAEPLDHAGRARRAPPGASDGFVGRAAELAVVEAALAEAMAGHPTVVSIEGAAGVGKSALVGRAVATLAADVTVAWAEADELAQTIPFMVVRQWAPVTASHPFAAGVDLLRWIGDAQASGPVVLVLEDLHWCDAPSREAVLTALRRLDHERVATLVTTRPHRRAESDGWDRARLDVTRFRSVELGGLDLADVGLLAERTGVVLGRRDVERLHRHTGGHALHVRTLLSEVPVQRLTRAGAALPAPRSLAATTVALLAQLPEPTRALACALAVLDGEAPLATVGVVADVGDPAAALEPLLPIGIVGWHPHEPSAPLRFAHPLYRSAVYDDLAPCERQRFHRRAIALVDRLAALRHRVAAADRPDDTLAAELEAAAATVRATTGAAEAAQYQRWAADASASVVDRERRLLSAVHLLVEGNELAAAAEHRAQVEACVASPQRSYLMGTLAYHLGDPVAMRRWLLEAADTSSGADAARALIDLGGYHAAHNRPEDALVVTRRALAEPGIERALELDGRAVLAVCVGSTHGPASGLATLEGHVPSDPSSGGGDEAWVLFARGLLHGHVRDPRRAVDDLRAALALGRANANVEQLYRCHLALCHAHHVLGDWDAAEVHAHVGLDLLIDSDNGWELAQAHASAALVPAGRGEWDVADRHVAAAAALVPPTATPGSWPWSQLCRATVSRARGNAVGTVRALDPLVRGDDARTLAQVTMTDWWAAYVEALIDTGDLARAAPHLGALERTASERSIDLSMRLASLRGALAAAQQQPAQALERFTAAMAAMDADQPLLDRADVHTRFGRLLLATGRRQLGVAQLRLAHGLVASVGAVPHLERVEADLAASGIPSPKRSSSRLALTDRERAVAALVATGRTNREVAGELYVSEKAVGYHLRNVFAKLGITTRRQLRAAPTESA